MTVPYVDPDMTAEALRARRPTIEAAKEARAVPIPIAEILWANDRQRGPSIKVGNLPKCQSCGEPMVIIEEGQTTHPSCDQPAGDKWQLFGAMDAVEESMISKKAVNAYLKRKRWKPPTWLGVDWRLVCKTCGDPPGRPALTKLCRDLHKICKDCGIDFAQPSADCTRYKMIKGDDGKRQRQYLHREKENDYAMARASV